jgi:hypothetical protein
MSFLMGKTQTRPNVSDETSGLHNSLIEYLTQQGFGGLNPTGQADPSMIEPYQKLFRDQNAQNFGQVKESAGTLTGSGLGNNLGIAAQRASTEQGAFLADMIERKRQADANRWSQLILGTLGSPAGGVTRTYQPGFLDYAIQGASAAAPFIAGPAGGAAAMAAGGGGMANAQPGGQLGQASFYKFLQPNDELYARDGTRTGLGMFFGGGRDSLGTADRRRLY